MKKRKPTPQESKFISESVASGCIICGRPAQWHHVRGARMDNAHCCGFPLCVGHHTGAEYPGQSIHSDHLLFTQKHGTELFLMNRNILRHWESKRDLLQTAIDRACEILSHGECPVESNMTDPFMDCDGRCYNGIDTADCWREYLCQAK